MTLLEVKDLKVHFKIQNGWVKAVDGVSFTIDSGETMGLVGESGCGKTTAAYAITQLLPSNGYIKGGMILFKEPSEVAAFRAEYDEKAKLTGKARAKETDRVRKRLNALGASESAEAGGLHEDVDDEVAKKRARDLFEFVGIAPDRIGNYPHEFSGGMKQRAMIALALALKPKFIIADEPTTALDVITQDRILVEIRKLQEKLNMAMMIITHDVSVVAEVSDKIGVMYAGLLMEIGITKEGFQKTAHPYTQGLLGSFPSIKGKKKRLLSIPGFPPDLVNPPPGCPFHPRCQYVQPLCSQERPKGIEIEPGHLSYCHFARELWDKLRDRKSTRLNSSQ